MPPGTLTDDAGRKRFRQEALALSQLNHPNICSIYEIGEVDGQTYIVMEYVEGQPLSAAIAGGGLAVETAVRYGVQNRRSAGPCARGGLLHRDLKNSNVMVTKQGRIKVLDFGLAKRVGQEAAEETRTQEALTERR